MHPFQNNITLCFLAIWIVISIASCTTEPEIPIYTLISSSEPIEAGSVLKSAEQREEGQNILIRAIPNKHWTFVSWAGDHNGTTKEINVLMDSDKNVTAIFEKREYALNIDIEGKGSVTEEIMSAKSADYQHGSVIKLKAEPDFGWEFIEWSGDVTGQDETLEVTIDGETNITAVFDLINFDLTVDVQGEGQVKQEVLAQKTTSYPFTSQVRLTAEPSAGWEFVNWTGDLESNNPVIDVDIDRDKKILATFKRIDYRVRVTIQGEGNVQQEIIQSKVIDSEYPFESVIQLIATPATNWLFSNWAQDASGIENMIVVNINSAKNITAKFVAIPTITTNSISQISQTGATSGGKISNGSGVLIVNKGICWSTNPETDPDINPNIECVQLGSGSTDFSAQMKDLKPSTTYYVRAVLEYSHHSTVTRVLGQERQFTTGNPVELPTLSTNSASSITSVSAVSGGNVTNNGGASVTSRGICWSTSQNPDSQNGTCLLSGSGNGSFSITMGNLTPSTSYYVRAYATNSAGTNFGNQITFGTSENASIAIVQTGSASSITTSSAVVSGNVTSNGGASVTDRGVCVSTSQNPTTSNTCYSGGAGNGSYNSTISSLASSTLYYARAYAINSAGTAYGSQINFTTETATTTPPPSSPPPSSNQIQIAILFLSSDFKFTTPVDILLNNVRYSYHGRNINDSIWNVFVTINGNTMPARGHVITLNENLVSVNFDLNQIKFDGYARGGFGNFNYKILKRHADTNLYSLNNNSGSINYWAGVTDETGTLQVYGDPNHPSPTFPYYEFGVTNADIGSSVSVANWNSTGKFVIVVGEVGNQ